MRKLTLYLINPTNETDLNYIDLDDEITEEVKNDFFYEANVILRDDGVEVGSYFRATDHQTGKLYDLAARFTKEFLDSADDDAIQIVIDVTLDAFVKLAQGIKDGTYS
ncbi:MAG: hypothetical protein RR853_08830 [Aurantimicrobium sp.]|uniref:hypothetical protein n=1 Tax=Aurantimicrobium sp. TaxID=1930784 RepID=UPI002FCC6FA9